jgi:hypothetical protein
MNVKQHCSCQVSRLSCVGPPAIMRVLSSAGCLLLCELPGNCEQVPSADALRGWEGKPNVLHCPASWSQRHRKADPAVKVGGGGLGGWGVGRDPAVENTKIGCRFFRNGCRSSGRMQYPRPLLRDLGVSSPVIIEGRGRFSSSPPPDLLFTPLFGTGAY